MIRLFPYVVMKTEQDVGGIMPFLYIGRYGAVVDKSSYLDGNKTPEEKSTQEKLQR